MVAVSTPWLIAASTLLVFLMLVILRFTIALVVQVKQLVRTARDASEQLQDAVADIRAESELASERLERLTEGSRRLKR